MPRGNAYVGALAQDRYGTRDVADARRARTSNICLDVVFGCVYELLHYFFSALCPGDGHSKASKTRAKWRRFARLSKDYSKKGVGSTRVQESIPRDP